MKTLPAYNFFLTPRCIMQQGVKLQIQEILRSEAKNEKLLGYDSGTQAGFGKKIEVKNFSFLSLYVIDLTFRPLPEFIFVLILINYFTA
jgi:hypothetical protein